MVVELESQPRASLPRVQIPTLNENVFLIVKVQTNESAVPVDSFKREPGSNASLNSSSIDSHESSRIASHDSSSNSSYESSSIASHDGSNVSLDGNNENSDSLNDATEISISLSDVTKNNTLNNVTEDNEALNYNTHVDASNDVTEDVNPLNDVTEISNTSDDVTDSVEKIVPEMKQEYQGKLNYLLRINRPLLLHLYHRSAGKIGNLGLFSTHKNKALPK